MDGIDAHTEEKFYSRSPGGILETVAITSTEPLSDSEAVCVVDATTLRIRDANKRFLSLMGISLDNETTLLDHVLDAGALLGATRAALESRNRSVVVKTHLSSRVGISFTADVMLQSETPRSGDRVVLTLKNIGSSDQTEDTLRERIASAVAHQRVIAELAKQDAPFETRVQSICRATAQTLHIDRVSFWRLHASPERLVCEQAYADGLWSSGEILVAGTHPHFFDALRSGRLISASNALTDHRTTDLTESYLLPASIGALMGVPVYSGGRLAGLVSHEHTRGTRDWTLEDQYFGLFAAQMLSLAMESREREALEVQIRDTEQRFRHIVDATPIPMWVVSFPDSLCLYANHAAGVLAGAPVEQLMNTRGFDLYERQEDRREVMRILSEKGAVRGHEVRFRRADSTTFWGLLSLQPVMYGSRSALIAGVVDVTTRKAMEESLRHIALHDSLTGLANRVMFLDALRREIGRLARNPSRRFSVCFIDLDGFKEVNDNFGHDAGDAVLRRVAEKLTDSVRPQDVASRFGGDEFAVLLTDLETEDDSRLATERLLVALRDLPPIAGVENLCSASIGVAMSSPSCTDAEQYIAVADAAMYKAKRAGKNRAVFERLSGRS